MMNGIAYCRVSSKEQVKGTSLDSQEQACVERARKDHAKILKIFIGRGESAKFADRPELLDLLEFCRKHKGLVHVLYVWKIDRLARNVSDFFNIKHLLLKYGVRVVSVTEPVDSNPEGKLLETILAGFAQFDNDIRTVRTIQGMRRKLQEGIWPWKAPMGYRSSVRIGEKKSMPDIPDQTLFPPLQRAWAKLQSGSYTKADIGRMLPRWGVLSKQGRPLSAQTIDKLFANPYYAGLLINPWTGEEHEGKHIPMVSREVFARVQVKKKRSKPHQKFHAEFPLRGLVRCPQCDEYLTAAFSKGRSKRYGYYSCGNKRCSTRPHIPLDKVHTEFKEFLATASIAPPLIACLERIIDGNVEKLQSHARNQRERKERQIAAVTTEVHKLIEMRTKEQVTDEEFREQKALLLQRRHAYEAAVTDTQQSGPDIRRELPRIRGPLADATATWHRFDSQSRRRFERLLFPVGFTAGQIRTAEKALLISLFSGSERPSTTEVDLNGEQLNQIMQEIQSLSMLFRDTHAQTDAA